MDELFLGAPLFSTRTYINIYDTSNKDVTKWETKQPVKIKLPDFENC